MKKWIPLLAVAILNTACANGQLSQSDDPNAIAITARGKTYRLFSVGDKVPSFEVNGRLIPKEAFEDYEPLFSELQIRLEEKKKKLAQKARVFTEQSRANLAADLVADKIVGSAAEITSFKLHNNGFTVNGQKQPFDVFTRYKAKYLSGSDYIIQFN